MSRKRRLLLAGSLLLLLAAGLWGAGKGIRDWMEKNVYDGTLVRLKEGEAVSMESLEGRERYAAAGEEQAGELMTAEGKPERAVMVPVSAAWWEMTGVSLKEGRYPQKKGECLLPESLAGKTGQTAVTWEGKEYAVSGVYQERELPAAMGEPVIYRAASKEEKLRLLLLPKSRPARRAWEEAAGWLGTGELEACEDLASLHLLGEELWKMGLILMAALPLLWMFQGTYRGIVSLYEGERTLKKMLYAALLFALSMGALAFLAGQFSIPSEYLPPDNLLDLSCYAGEMKEGVNRAKASVWAVDFYRTGVFGLWAEAALMLLAAACFWAGALVLRRFGKRRKKERTAPRSGEPAKVLY